MDQWSDLIQDSFICSYIQGIPHLQWGLGSQNLYRYRNAKMSEMVDFRSLKPPTPVGYGGPSVAYRRLKTKTYQFLAENRKLCFSAFLRPYKSLWTQPQHSSSQVHRTKRCPTHNFGIQKYTTKCNSNANTFEKYSIPNVLKSAGSKSAENEGQLLYKLSKFHVQ